MRQEQLWTPTAELPVSAGHPFYERLNHVLDERKFDEFVESMCARFLCREDGTPGTGSGNLLPVADGRLFRGHRFGTRHRLARQRQPLDPLVRAHRAG